MRSCVALTVAILLLNLSLCHANCGQGWIYSPFGTCYLFVSVKANWYAAEGMCRDHGGSLATLDSKAEINFIKGTRWTNVYQGQADGHYWIGGRKQNGKWLWKTMFGSENIGATDWFPNEPNNSGGKEDCLELYYISTQGGAWNDIPCDSINEGYLCEKSATGDFGR